MHEILIFPLLEFWRDMEYHNSLLEHSLSNQMFSLELFIPSVFRVCWKCSAYCWPLTRGGEGEGGGGCIGIQRLSCYFRIISRNFPFTDGKPKERMFFLTPSLPVAGLELLLFTSTEVVTASYANTRNIWSWLQTTDYCRDCCVLLNDSNRRE